MRYAELRQLASKLYFTYEDVADTLKINQASAKVLCSRYAEKCLFIRLKKNLYVLKERWEQNSVQELYRISNVLQVPSYISLMTALSYYELTTQVQRGVIEAVSVKRTVKDEINDIAFYFYKIKKDLYFDFVKTGDFFIATKEKAFLDALYLYSLGKYAFDIDSIDIAKLDIKRIKKLLKKFPDKTKKVVKTICRI
jgi:predicted transcriptional regulator of viral defense system